MAGISQGTIIGWLLLHLAFGLTQAAFPHFANIDFAGCEAPALWMCGTPIQPFTEAVFDFEFGWGILLEAFSVMQGAVVSIARVWLMDYAILHWEGPLGIISWMIRAIAGVTVVYMVAGIAIKILFLDR